MTEGSFNPMVRKPMHPGMQFLVLSGLLIAAIFLGQILAGLIISARFGLSAAMAIAKLDLTAPHAKTSLWIMQFAGTTLPILITPIIFAYTIVKDPNDYIKNHFHFPGSLLIVVILTMFLAGPLIEYLGIINQKINLPQWMIQDDKELERVSDFMMQTDSLWDMIYNLLFIGLLTAIVEEVLFRGCMQTIFIRWFKNPHVAVWITAILFSTFHMEFLGFIPRLFLGVAFGYFAVWSGSVWPAILAHFVNNGTIVVWEYLYQQKITSIDPSTPQLFNNTGYIISFILTLVLLLIYRYLSNKWHSAHYGKELD